jgi:hypothetical protein
MKRICHPDQLNLLDLLRDLRPKHTDFSSLNIDLLFRAALARAIKESGLSRIQIAAKMSEILDVEITKAILDSWTAESREGVNRFPACYLPVFCHVVGSIEPLRVLADLIGSYVIQGPEALDLAEKRIQDQERKLADEKRAIRAMRHGMEKKR